MAIIDAGPFQDWVRAFDRHDQAQPRHDAAGRIGNQALIQHLRSELDAAARELNNATRALNAQVR